MYKKRDFPVSEIRRFLEPGPVVLVRLAWKGKKNVMTMGWHTVMEFSPSLIGCIISNQNHSFEMINQSKECVINVPTQDMARKVVGIGNCSGSEIDEFRKFKLTASPATKVDAPSTAPNSNLNPYIDYWTNDNRRIFEAGKSLTRTYQIVLPADKLVMGYAVDSCWEPPSPNPPVNVPGDFPLNANRPEPYNVTALQQDPLAAAKGAFCVVQVRAYDWQLNPSTAWIECPDLWSGRKYNTSSNPETDGATFQVPITNDTGALEGTYRALIGIQDALQRVRHKIQPLIYLSTLRYQDRPAAQTLLWRISTRRPT